MLVYNLTETILQQNCKLIKRLDLSLQPDPVYHKDIDMNMLFTQCIQELDLQILSLCIHFLLRS